MIISLAADGSVALEDAHNFRAFKLVVKQPGADLAAAAKALAGVATLPDRDTAWVSQGALQRWPSVANDETWQQSFAAMIDKARPYGWIDDEAKAIKAHIEWAD